MGNGVEKKKKDKGKGSITAGFILVGIGLVFLLDNLDIIPSLGETWPLFLIIIGAALLIGALRDKKTTDSTMPPITPTEPTTPPPLG
jgi:hypothetical protein